MGVKVGRLISYLKQTNIKSIADEDTDEYWVLVLNLIDIFKRYHKEYAQHTAIVFAVPTLLEGGVGVFHGEDGHTQSVLSRPDARTRVQRTIELLLPAKKETCPLRDDIHELVNITEATILAHKGPISDDEEEDFFEQLKDLTGFFKKSGASLDGGINLLIALRIELAGVDGYLTRDDMPSPKLMEKEDGGS